MDRVINQYTQEIVKKGKKMIPEEIIIISLCERFCWSYDDYMNTPPWFIDLILAKDDIDNKLNKLKNGSK